MAGSADTLQGMPGPVRLGALRRLAGYIGPQELWGRNWGPLIVKWGGYFISKTRLMSFAPGQVNEGKLQWCALAVCGVVQEEFEARGHLEIAAQWKRIASAECSRLWANMDSLGWCWRAGAPLPQALSPQATQAPGLPGPGDFVFYGEEEGGKLHFAHVDLFEQSTVNGFDSIGGNTGDPPVYDRVGRVRHRTLAKLSRVIGYGRVPW